MAFVAGYCIGPLGIDFTKKTTSALHQVGQKAWDHMGRKWVYVKFAGTVVLGNLVKAGNTATPYSTAVIGTASAAASAMLGMCGQGFVSGDFGWIVQTGVFEDDAQLAAVSVGEPFESDANGDCILAAAGSLNNAVGIVLVDGGAAGTVLLDCIA